MAKPWSVLLWSLNHIEGVDARNKSILVQLIKNLSRITKNRKQPDSFAGKLQIHF
jgi:hypothetical protein